MQKEFMERKKAWVWFKGGLTGGEWVSGFKAVSDEREGLLIERTDFVSCRVPEWRVRFTEPEDPKAKPQIPENPTWKYH